MEGSLHQTYSYLEDVVLQRKVREAVPEAAGARLGLLTCLKQVLARVINLELRHFLNIYFFLYECSEDAVMMMMVVVVGEGFGR